MAATLQNQLESLVAKTPVPWTGEPLDPSVSLAVDDRGPRVRAVISPGYPAAASGEAYLAALRAGVADATGRSDIDFVLDGTVKRHAVQGTLSPVKGVRNIIAVSSAKGGVGKSTVAANLALALRHEGAKVGVLDADIYGPSQPIMLGVEGQQPVSRDGKTFEPIQALGLQMISIGCLIDPGQPMVWRGPMVTQALNQMLFQTNWDDLDYLIVDMPPGTGDIQLTLGQKVPVAGAVIVTTPQDIALADAIRGLHMFEKVNIHVLGLVENMSSFVCPSCGEVTPLFGEGGGVAAAQAHKLTLLGKLPLDLHIREQADSGCPTAAAEPESPQGRLFRDMALATAAALARRPKDYKGAFSGIRVETQ